MKRFTLYELQNAPSLQREPDRSLKVSIPNTLRVWFNHRAAEAIVERPTLFKNERGVWDSRWQEAGRYFPATDVQIEATAGG